MQQSERIAAFVDAIWSWYAIHKRSLPWRDLQIADDAERAYRILVSEIMLQQTQVSRVIVAYKNFLACFPTIRDLADASNRDVLIAWRGMGYNSRAMRLRDAARAICAREAPRTKHQIPIKFKRSNSKSNKPVNQLTNKPVNIVFPTSMKALQSIPGVGHYTAAAIRNFAFNIPTPCLDTNIRRILHRTFVGPESADGTWEKLDSFLLEIAEEVLMKAISDQRLAVSSMAARCTLHAGRSTADWHAALMDFGSLVQTKSNPKWDQCPLTAKKLMKTTPKHFSQSQTRKPMNRFINAPNKEPGRYVGSNYIPNRIFRGKIVDALRDAPRGLSLQEIGKHVCSDWNAKEHREWMKNLITKLVQDGMLSRAGTTLILAT